MSRSPLDLDEETMRRLGSRVSDLVARHLATIRDEPVIAPVDRAELNRVLDGEPPLDPIDFESLVETLCDHVFPFHAREPHPGFLAYIPSCPTFPAVLGDWLASGYNFFAGVWPIAPGPNQIELIVLEWFRSWMGMPAGSTGLLTSGGSAANLTAVVAARHNAVESGSELSSLVVYASEHAHSSVVRAAWMAGISRGNVRTVSVDDGFALDVEDLARKVAADRRSGLTPLLVTANAGTTNTGAVDPLHAIADFARTENLWLHVDAAYAGFAALTAEGKRMLSGIERADSMTLDPHKWLYVPFECGCLMVRDPAMLTSAFRIMPEYLKDVEAAEEEVNFADRGEQLTRYSRALKIWLSVGYFGTRAIAAEIEHAMERARLAESIVRESPHLELLSPARFGIVCFRARLPSAKREDVDALNTRVNARVVAGGRFLISSTRLRGVFSLRMCTLGYRTTDRDIRELFATIHQALETEAAGEASTAAKQPM